MSILVQPVRLLSLHHIYANCVLPLSINVLCHIRYLSGVAICCLDIVKLRSKGGEGEGVGERERKRERERGGGG